MLTLDGSAGEGGGQILRTALALSLVTGRAVGIEQIRAGRKKPGLLRQHLAAVRAAEALGAEVSGAELGSDAIAIRPGPVRTGDHRFVVGSAGSANLVLQTVLPPLMLADGPSLIRIEGGTHNPFAPPFDFIDRVFLPVVNRMGPKVRARLERTGFYPAGGGQLVVEIEPAQALVPLELMERGEILRTRATALFAKLPASIAKRELEAIRRRLGLEDPDLLIQEDLTSVGPGNVLLVETEFTEGREICTGFAERGVRAEKVAKRAAEEMDRFLSSGAPVGVRLADQLMIPFALAGRGRFRTLPLSQHSRTNLDVIRRFLDTQISVLESECTTEIVFSKAASR